MIRKSVLLSVPFLLVCLLAFTACTAEPSPPPVSAQQVAPPTAAATQPADPPAPTFSATAEPTVPPTSSPAPTFTPSPTPAVLVGAGDVAICGDVPESQGDEQTAALIDGVIAEHPNAMVFVAGDVAYGEGRAVEFQNCFGPSWGRFKERVRPVPGNHDYMSPGAQPYFDYFGAAAGPPGLGYYSYDLGGWHIVALNSNCNDIACGPNSPQVAWLREDLQKNTAECTLAYWHHPRFSSGLAGGSGVINPFWRAAYELGVDVVVAAHDHNYERFAPMNVEGQPDPQGVRSFVVGTGGGIQRGMGTPQPNSEVAYSREFGVIVFKLYPGRYEWTFLPAGDPANTDSGSGVCR